MSGPTLFKAGSLIAHDYSESQDVLDKFKPIDYIMEWFGKRINKIPSGVQDRMLVLMSSTGSGKSTTIPPELFGRFFEKTGRRNICCTQPRVLTSQEIPKTILEWHPELKMGVNIGFQNGVQAKRPTRGIIFMTVGVLKQQLKIMSDEEFLKKYSFIIIDEAHERSVDLDLTLSMMKALILRNITKADCPFLVAMSATFNPEKFADYMLSTMPKDRYKNIIKVSGFTYPIQETWLDYDTTDFIKAAVDRTIQIHETNLDDVMDANELKSKFKPPKSDKLLIKDDAIKARLEAQKFRDILIFVSGKGDAKKIIKALQSLNSTNQTFQEYPIIPLQLMREDINGRSENYINITRPYNKMTIEVRTKDRKTKNVHPTRRVIVSTNVAETGITIETLKYVIDTGFNNSSEYDPTYRVEMLITKPVTKSMYIQRRGRAGRKAPGFAFPLYTQTTYQSLIDDQFPDIVKKDTALDILSLIILTCDPTGSYNQASVAELLMESVHSIQSAPEIRKDLRRRVMQNLIQDENRLALSKYETELGAAKVDLYKFDILEHPNIDSMHTSLDRLYTLGAINNNTTPTAIGLIINKFRFIELECIRFILAGYAWEVPIIDLITIAAFTAVKQDLFINPRDLTDQYNPNPAPDSLKYSCDFITTLIWWYRYQEACSNHMFNDGPTPEDWCIRNGLKSSFMIEAADARQDIILSMAGIGLNPYAWNEHAYINRSDLDDLNWIAGIKQCLFEGYKLNICMWNPIKNLYESRYGRLPLPIDRPFLATRLDLVEYGGQNPKFILYDSLSYRPDTKLNEYKPSIRYITVLDGFIPLDPDFDT
jgi:HrpA-like RNA helicase